MHPEAIEQEVPLTMPACVALVMVLSVPPPMKLACDVLEMVCRSPQTMPAKVDEETKFC